MKKIFSLLMFALLTMSAWAETTVTFVPGNPLGNNSNAGDADATMTLDGVTITSTKGAFGRTDNFRFGQGATITFTSTVGNITKVEITSTANYGSQYGPNNLSGEGYTAQSGSKVGTWTGNAASFQLTASAQVRASQIVVTIADEPVEELVAPVFHPNGGEFTGSLEVTLTCATPNAEIQYYECDPVTHEIDWTTYNYYNGPFYVNATKTFAAYASKGNEVSDYAYATFTKVLPTVANPTFTPASGTTFEEDLAIRIDCETEGATILYQVNDGDVEMDEAPIFLTLTATSTVTAIASKDGYNDSEEVTATYTKVEPATGTCITFNSANDKGNGSSTTTGPWTVEKNGITMACTEGRVYDEGYRIYKDKTLTFTSTVGNITRIEFDGVAQSGYALTNFTTPTGSYNATASSALWIGDAAEIVFTAGAQTRASEIRVYVNGEVVTIAAPTIPASQNFDDSITVEIINNEDGATVMYKTTGDWTTYTEALTFTETTTLQAKAVKNEVESSTVTATYTKNEPTPEYTTLAQVNVLGNGVDFEFKGNVVVTAQKKNYLWLRDESGYGLIYGNINNQNNLTFAPGTVLNQGWTAQTKIYSGLMEYVEANNVSASEDTNPTLAAIQTITELDTTMVNAYVQVLNVKSFAVNGRNVTATMLDGTQMVMYNTFDESIPTEEGNYTVEGAVSTHNGMQLIIIGIEGFVPETIDVDNIAQAYELNPNTTFTMYNDVVVTYHDTVGNRLFIRDTEDNSGMIYGALEGEPTFNNGDVLSDGWTATFSVYQNTPEFTNAEGIAASGDTREAAPFERNAEEIDIMNVHEYIVLKNQTVLPDNTGGSNSDKRFFIDLPNDSLVLFNQFNVELPAIEEGKTYDVTGIVTIYRSKAQVYILEMTENAPAFTRGDVDMDGFVRISDVTALINYLLTNDPTGIDLNAADTDQDTFVKISDVTTLINYLLSGNWE